MSALDQAKAAMSGVIELDPLSDLHLVIRDNHTSVLSAHEVELRAALLALIVEHREALRRISVFEDGWNMLHFSCDNADHGEAYKLMSDVALAPKVEVPE